jgi:hypothetical protein
MAAERRISTAWSALGLVDVFEASIAYHARKIDHSTVAILYDPIVDRQRQ